MTTAYLTAAHLIPWQVAATLAAAVLACLVAGAIGGDKADDELRGTRWTETTEVQS